MFTDINFKINHFFSTLLQYNVCKEKKRQEKKRRNGDLSSEYKMNRMTFLFLFGFEGSASL